MNRNEDFPNVIYKCDYVRTHSELCDQCLLKYGIHARCLFVHNSFVTSDLDILKEQLLDFFKTNQYHRTTSDIGVCCGITELTGRIVP